MVLLLSHQGLGDHLACNGLYREIALRFDSVLLPVVIRYKRDLDIMLSDVPNLTLIPILNAFPFRQQRILAGLLQNFNVSILRLGRFDPNFFFRKEIRLDEYFYQQMSVPHKVRWDKFEYKRNREKEDKLLNSMLNGSSEPYIFLHEDRSRGFLIDRTRIKSSLRVISPDPTSGKSIFEYRSVIQNAAEIHCIESSFSAFIDSIDCTKPKKYIHRYSRPEAKHDFCHEFTYRSTWEILL